VRKDGSEFPMELSLASWSTSDGMLLGAIMRDISERKHAMQELARVSQHNELILNSAGEGIVGLDTHGRVTFVNPAAAEMTGYASPHELIGRTLQHDCRHPLGACPLRQAPADCEAVSSSQALFWRKDGSRLPVEFSVRPICVQGSVAGAVVTFRDITERLAMEKVKDEFVSVVSHELRTPLTSIRASLGLLAGGVLTEVPDKAQRMLEIAVSNADRLTRLVNDILDIERLESGRADLHPTVCDAATLVQHAAEEMRGMAQAAGVALLVEPSSGQLVADADRVLQVLTNLVSNAIKFSAPGSSVRLDSSVSDSVPEVVFTVRDQGRGIAPDKLEAIFERFLQVDASDSREKGGTGLGLAICKSIVRQHGGRIWAESTPGAGSTFFVALPVSA
jgi:PAS domain S-box-containing protein